MNHFKHFSPLGIIINTLNTASLHTYTDECHLFEVKDLGVLFDI